MADDVARVLDATDIVALISEHVSLRRSGRRWVGLCPFHSEDTASFSVNQEDGLYYCFGCQAKGNALSFVRSIEHVDFLEALQILANRANIELSRDGGFDSKSAEKRGQLQSLMKRAEEYFYGMLRDEQEGKEARDYLSLRGITTQSWDRFRIGWAPTGQNLLSRALKAPADIMVEAGLGYQDSSGRLRDHLQGRIVFPIRDTSGSVIGFGGRILPSISEARSPDQASLPKYKNSPETPLYSKRRVLYALDLAKSEVVNRGEIVVCEGYTDVIAMFQSGVTNAVATCGTALSPEHFERIKNFAKRVVLAFDADSAGQSAAERLYQFERKHQLELMVVDLPGGKDPGELGVSDPDALASAVREARPFLMFRIERELARADLSSNEGRATAAEAGLRMVAEHPSPLVRSNYVPFIADRTGMDIKVVESRLREIGRGISVGGRGATTSEQSKRLTSARHRSNRPAHEALRLLVADPGLYSEFIIPELFDEDEQVMLARLLQGVENTREGAIIVEEIGGEVARLFFELASEQREVDPLDVVARQVEVASSRRIRLLSNRLRSPSFPVSGQSDLVREVGGAKKWVEELRDLTSRDRAAGQLIAWLKQSDTYSDELGQESRL